MVLIRGRCSPLASEEPVRYLNSFDISIPAHDFESEIHSFVEAVLGRLADMHTEAAELDELWNELMAERYDPELTVWRKLEAILGHDPDDAPQHIIEALRIAAERYGPNAVEEVAAESSGRS